MNKHERALTALVDTIEATGGIVECGMSSPAPVGDPHWGDLGDAYVLACDALGRKPKITAESQDDRMDRMGIPIPGSLA